MIGNLISLVVLIALVVLFGWLAKRAWVSKRAILKWAGVILAGLITLLVALVTVIALIGFYKVYAPRSYAAPTLQAAATPEQITRGQHLAAVLCTGCHSMNDQLPLSGGGDLVAQANLPPLGTFFAPNLTAGGPLKNWSDGDIARAFRAGISPDGRLLYLMSAMDARFLSDEDLAALIAYLRSQPAVQKETPAENVSLLGVLMAGAGLIPQQPPVTGTVSAPARSSTAEYGQYVVSYAGCRGCHGEDLSGGTGLAKGPNLTVRVPKWTQDQFVTAIHAAAAANAEMTPVTRLDDVELAAVYQYMHGLTPIQK